MRTQWSKLMIELCARAMGGLQMGYEWAMELQTQKSQLALANFLALKIS